MKFHRHVVSRHNGGLIEGLLERLCTIYCSWYSDSFRVALKWSLMIPRGASLSESSTPDRTFFGWFFYRNFRSIFLIKILDQFFNQNFRSICLSKFSINFLIQIFAFFFTFNALYTQEVYRGADCSLTLDSLPHNSEPSGVHSEGSFFFRFFFRVFFLDFFFRVIFLYLCCSLPSGGVPRSGLQPNPRLPASQHSVHPEG